MTDSTDGAWKSPAKTSALWSNKEPESQREKYGWKRKKDGGGDDGGQRKGEYERDYGEKREEKVV